MAAPQRRRVQSTPDISKEGLSCRINKTRTTALKRSPSPPPPHSASRPLFIRWFAALQNGAREGNEKSRLAPSSTPASSQPEGSATAARSQPLPLNSPAPPPRDCHHPRAPSLPPSRLLLTYRPSQQLTPQQALRRSLSVGTTLLRCFFHPLPPPRADVASFFCFLWR